MTTDWILIRRAAAELERALRGARVTDAGLLDDGRIALRFVLRQAQDDKLRQAQDDKLRHAQDDGLPKRAKGAATATLAIDPFGSPPTVTVEDAELAVAADPGWLRSAATTLRGTRLSSVRARRGDRVLVLTFGTASRFGVESESRLVLELVPRYGNVVLLHDRTVVAAAKQFSPAENEARSVQVGLPYEPPPLTVAALDAEGFANALETAADAKATVRALGGYLPEVPRLLAESVVAETGAAGDSPARLARRLEDRAREVLAAAEAGAESGDSGAPVHVYRDAESVPLAAHVVPLAQFAALAHRESPHLLAVFAEARAKATSARRGDAAERRRAALLTRIAKRAQATAGESTAVAGRLAAAAERDRLRACGDALYTHAHEVPPGATAFVPPTNPELSVALDPELDAKENAQRYYARYRKATDALPHLERRRETLAARSDALDVLAFEAERADAATLPELEADLEMLEGRPPRKAQQTSAKRRPPLRVERPSGARIYVGRSPRENAEITFRLARPDDLWFHARGIPGSHVVLQAPPGSPPADDDLDAAADLAATHSKARATPRVEIDYTERKYVRKQRDGAPGLVWYTNARTRIGRPDAIPGR